VQIGGGEDRPDAGRKSDKDLTCSRSRARRGSGWAGPLFSIISIVEVPVDSGPFRLSDVACLRIDPEDNGGALSASGSSSANLAWNAFSNCRASATFNEFLAGRTRRGSISRVNPFNVNYEQVTQHS
jgi:hypothetical protein